jgi:hypothetical protein
MNQSTILYYIQQEEDIIISKNHGVKIDLKKNNKYLCSIKN